MVVGHSRWASSIVAVLVCWSLCGAAAAAETRVSENASRRFSQGVRYLTSQDPERYEKAYREFKAAYADSPSWKILGNLGIVAHELERDGEAIDAFKAYLERGGKELGADERKQFKEDLEVVEGGYATLTIETTPDGGWIIDERLPETGAPIVNRYGPTKGQLVLRVRAGHHRIRAEINGFESDAWELSNVPGETAQREFVLRKAGSERDEARDTEAPPVEPPHDPRHDSHGGDGSALRVGSYVAFGLGAVGVGLGTYFLLDALDKQKHADDLYADCEAVVPSCAGPANGLRERALAAQSEEGSAFTRSRVSYIAGGALVATGVVLLLVSSGGSSESDPTSEASITPWVSPNSLGLTGRF